jgi:hypothetical protein
MHHIPPHPTTPHPITSTQLVVNQQEQHSQSMPTNFSTLEK